MGGRIQTQDIKTVAELVAAGATAASLPQDSQVYVSANALNKTLKAAIEAGDIGGGALIVTGTRAAPALISAATGISFSGSSSRQLWFIEGNGGEVNITASPQIAAGVTLGQELVLMGRNDAAIVILEDGTGLSLNGEMFLGAAAVLSLVWDGVNWVEASRR